MKASALFLLLATSVTLGCMEFPTYPIAARDGQPVRLTAPEPVSGDDISAENAYEKARQLAAELDFAEAQGESKPGTEKALEGKTASRKNDKMTR